MHSDLKFCDKLFPNYKVVYGVHYLYDAFLVHLYFVSKHSKRRRSFIQAVGDRRHICRSMFVLWVVTLRGLGRDTSVSE